MTFPNVVFIRHKVINFRRWKAVFDAHSPAWLAQGCKGAHIFRRADNPKELVVMLTWGDLGKARQFLASDDLRNMLAEVAVSDRTSDVYLLEGVEETSLSTIQDPSPRANGEPSGTNPGGTMMTSSRLATCEPSDQRLGTSAGTSPKRIP